MHIVSFNIPYPANYGGVIDVFYRIRALSRQGVRIHLHCYTYGRPPAPELNEYCEDVHYYRRSTLPHKLLTREPYIVSSRRSRKLLHRLLQDHEPVLLEGLHCCWLLPLLRQADPNRLLLVRAHNVEHHYYDKLARSEHCLPRRWYLRGDARKLKRYEPVLRNASRILVISRGDEKYFNRQHYAPVSLVSGSHGCDDAVAPTGFGKFVLVHGDLSVADNQRSVSLLLDNVVSHVQQPFVFAGKNPPRQLRQEIARHPNATLVANPSEARMQELLSQAHICILHTNQATGIKLKLLHALYSSRHCVVNSLMVEGTGLAKLCCVADTPVAMREVIEDLYQRPFTQQQYQQRRQLLAQCYDDAVSAAVVIDLLSKDLVNGE